MTSCQFYVCYYRPCHLIGICKLHLWDLVAVTNTTACNFDLLEWLYTRLPFSKKKTLIKMQTVVELQMNFILSALFWSVWNQHISLEINLFWTNRKAQPSQVEIIWFVSKRTTLHWSRIDIQYKHKDDNYNL